MNAKRFAPALAFALLFTVRVHADTEPGHFLVNLQDDCSNLTEFETNPVCTVSPSDTSAFTGGWGDASFTTEVSNTPDGIKTTGFTTNGECDTNDDHDHYHWFWFWWPWHGHGYNNKNGCDNDPSIRVDPGGKSSPFPSSFSLVPGDKGGGIFDFQDDTGSPFDEVEFITTAVPGEDYTCASTIFQECGFKVVDGNQLDILFWDGSIPTVVPEPASLVLLLGCVAVAGIHRVRSRRRRV